MTQSGNVMGAQPSVWAVGKLSADELERLAGEIRPSWEIGLDAANDGPATVAAAAIVPSATGFAAAPSMLTADLGSMSNGMQSASVNMAIATVAPHVAVPPRAAPPSPPPAPARVAPPVNAFASQPVPATARPWEEAAPASKPKGVLYGGIAAGIAAVGLIAFLALRGGSAPTPTASAPPATTQGSIAPDALTGVPAVPVAAAASPSRVAPGVRVAIADEPPATGPSSHRGHQRHADAPPPPPPVVHAAAPPVVAHTTVAAAPAPHHHSTASHGTHRMRGAGFVTDSPY